MATININGYFLPVQPGEKVLNALESRGIEMKSQCRDGFCGACACKAKKVEGVVHTDNAILTIDTDKEILPCSAIIQEDCELELEIETMVLKP
ncbi:2Fe-2S iron-sulfur cluster-binding protein [Shewanella marisflavi]|uniref:2Fe-2S iron-sulfur cluster-binding protein n=1 Tax=Shewanella marisflavi TaxID=260364 RepID=UPI003AAD9F64